MFLGRIDYSIHGAFVLLADAVQNIARLRLCEWHLNGRYQRNAQTANMFYHVAKPIFEALVAQRGVEAALSCIRIASMNRRSLRWYCSSNGEFSVTLKELLQSQSQ